MQELRLVGVREDGGHLLLSNDDGEEFTLPVTEALRSAATRPIGRPSAQAADAAEGSLSPRDIQARIRGGATAEQVSAESGVDLDRVRKYEGPVLAERDWMAAQARQVEVSAPQPGHDLYRSTFGDEPALLGPMVRHRMASLGLDANVATWDAWREQDGSWTVQVDFPVAEGQTSAAAIGEQPPARWTFRPSSRHLDNQNRWAQVLSELDPLDGPFGGRRLTAVGDRPFNVEEAEQDPQPAARGPRPAVDQDSQDELLDVLRARRGQRLGVDEEADDELALMLTRDEQPTAPGERPRLSVAPHFEDPADEEDPADSADGWSVSEEPSDETDEAQDPDRPGDGDEDPRGDTRDDSEYPGQTVLDFGADRPGPERTEQAEEDDAPRPRQSPTRSRRPSVPSWDEIVFGRKGD